MPVNIQNGIGASRDSALRFSRRENPRTFNLCVDQDRVTLKLGISVQHADLANGDFVSVSDGRAVPLAPGLEFGGLIEKIGEDNLGRPVSSVITRCALCVLLQGLTPETKKGTAVFALPGHRTVFTLEKDAGGVHVGEFLAVENLYRSMGTIGIRLEADARRW